MCTYQTQHVAVRGSGKGPNGWFPVTDATIYLDHPVHAQADHTLNLDFRNPARGPAARIAVELHPDAALQLARAILETLELAPAGLVPIPPNVCSIPPGHRDRSGLI